MKLWKRNAIAAAIVLFVCGAVYLNWSYSQDTAAGKNLGGGGPWWAVRMILCWRSRRRGRPQRKAPLGKRGPDRGGAAAQEGVDAESGTYFSTARPQPAAGPGQRPLPAPGGRRG